jgi:hypothetical protein
MPPPVRRRRRHVEGSRGSPKRQPLIDLLNNKSAALAAFTSHVTGTTPKYSHTAIKVPGGGVVDTSRFAYGLGVCPQGDSAFSGAIIAYTG